MRTRSSKHKRYQPDRNQILTGKRIQQPGLTTTNIYDQVHEIERQINDNFVKLLAVLNIDSKYL